MAETHDTRAWQAGVDPVLVTRLQRPLRRSAAIACAWAREALARGKRGGLPLFASWSVRWGMNEAAVAGLRPIVHALPFERAPAAAAAPTIAAAQARLAPEVSRAAIVAVARNAASAEHDATRGGAARTGHEGSQRAASELGGPAVATSEGPRELGRGEPAGSPTAAPRVDPSPQVAVTRPQHEAPTGLDLRVDPALLVPGSAAPATAGRTGVVHAPASESGPSIRPRARPRLVTTMDLARAQQLAAPSQPSATVAATDAPRTPSREVPASIVATQEPDEPGVGVIAPPGSTAALRVGTTSMGEPAPAVVHAPPPSSAAPVPEAAPGIAGPVVAPTPTVAALRVRGRAVVARVSPVLVDSLPDSPSVRPRVSLPSPPRSPSPGLTAATSAEHAAPRIDVALPAAQSTAQSTAATPQPAPQSPPAPRPVVARVETSQLDIPAIAQAVHRHLERELRWERERRGGRP